MPFVKLDTGILQSTLWVERECREVFLTALLMAEPMEATKPLPQLEVRSLRETGFVVPVGWYGFVSAAGIGIVRFAMVDQEIGLIALERLGAPDPESRSKEFEGRRLVRVDGGYVILNYMKYRERDYTSAERSRRYRERKKLLESRVTATRSHRDITQAEAEAEAEAEADSRSIKESKTMTRSLKFALPSIGEITAYCNQRMNHVDPQQFFDHYTSNGWKVGRNLMRDWRAAVRTWEKNDFKGGSNGLTKAQQRTINNRKVLLEDLSLLTYEDAGAGGDPVQGRIDERGDALVGEVIDGRKPRSR